MNEDYKQAAIENIKSISDGSTFLTTKMYNEKVRNTRFTQWHLNLHGIKLNQLKRWAGLPVSKSGINPGGRYNKRGTVNRNSITWKDSCLKCGKTIMVTKTHRCCKVCRKSNSENSDNNIY